ncbi:MAG TPA: GTP-binding protein, partial [Puia sp.]
TAAVLPLSPVKIHLLSGFLGAGKTTAIEQAVKFLQKQNTPVAVVTNDQGISLVDGQRISHLNIPTAEVTGGCFCCNYNTLEANIRTLTTARLLFAESVGSCTDLIATVLKPLLDQHPEWQPTVSIFADARELDNSSVHPSVRYIYEKQLEEAQVLVITRSESFSPQWKQQLKARFPDKSILFHDSYDESDIRRWLDTLETLPAQPKLPSLEIDYDIYAEGEARLAWLDQQLAIDSQPAADHLMKTIEKKLENYPVRRLKFWSTPSTLLINARVQTDPQTLSQLVAGAIAETNARYNANLRTLTHQAFQPGYPRPQHRMA